jgi:hypothetical protein
VTIRLEYGTVCYLVSRINKCSPCFRTSYTSTNQFAAVTSAILHDWPEFRSWCDRDYTYLSLGPSICDMAASCTVVILLSIVQVQA